MRFSNLKGINLKKQQSLGVNKSFDLKHSSNQIPSKIINDTTQQGLKRNTYWWGNERRIYLPNIKMLMPSKLTCPNQE